MSPATVVALKRSSQSSLLHDGETPSGWLKIGRMDRRLLGWSPLQHAEVGQPLLEADMPGSKRNSIPFADRSTMTAVCIDVQIRRHAGAKQHVVEFDRLPGVKRVVESRACKK